MEFARWLYNTVEYKCDMSLNIWHKKCFQIDHHFEYSDSRQKMAVSAVVLVLFLWCQCASFTLSFFAIGLCNCKNETKKPTCFASATYTNTWEDATLNLCNLYSSAALIAECFALRYLRVIPLIFYVCIPLFCFLLERFEIWFNLMQMWFVNFSRLLNGRRSYARHAHLWYMNIWCLISMSWLILITTLLLKIERLRQGESLCIDHCLNLLHTTCDTLKLLLKYSPISATPNVVIATTPMVARQ